jgi:very-short-patch-repair endonuclease
MDPPFDADRTVFLERAGWRVARISNADVFVGGAQGRRLRRDKCA